MVGEGLGGSIVRGSREMSSGPMVSGSKLLLDVEVNGDGVVKGRGRVE